MQLLLSQFAILVPLLIFLFSLVQRFIRLETKFDCLLEWVIDVGPIRNFIDIKDKKKYYKLKKEIEKNLNNNGCRID